MSVKSICVIGLGYVGLPLTLELAKHFYTVGFDINENRVAGLNKCIDSNCEYSFADLDTTNALFTTDPSRISLADFIIVTVPTPITLGNKPDLEPLRAVSELIGNYADFSLKPIIVYESTVYPGVTEEYCVPIITEAANNSRVFPYDKRVMCNVDFFVGYSPERINPGDTVHTVSTITKIVSGSTNDTLDAIDSVYSMVTKTHRAPNIKVAEAAKVIENTQRDVNIALVNELALIFDQVGIDTQDVLDAAATKWNFLNFRPGLVGGHCIGVDPYWLLYRATLSGVDSQVIAASRRINDSMARHVANITVRALNDVRKTVNSSTIVVLGATFKENCKDTRNSKVGDIITELQNLGGDVWIHDPFYADDKVVSFEHNVVKTIPSYDWISDVDAVILAVPHQEYKELGYENIRRVAPTIIDVKGILGKHSGVVRL